MIGFQSDAQLPPATRIRVTLDAGLQDLQAHRLDHDLAWTFNTPPLRFTLPQDAPTPGIVPLKPVIRVAASTTIDPATFAQHSAFISSASSSVAATAVLESPPPGAQQIVYDVSPQSPLQRASTYRLSIAPGVLPYTGNLPSQAQFTVRQ